MTLYNFQLNYWMKACNVMCVCVGGREREKGILSFEKRKKKESKYLRKAIACPSMDCNP